MVGLHLAGFLLQPAAAAASPNSCAAMCHCKKSAPAFKALSSQHPSEGCCPVNSAPACKLKDNAGLHIQTLALHHIQIPGKRLNTFPAAIDLNLSEYQLQLKAWPRASRLAVRSPGPTYLEKRSLLC